MKKRIKIAAVAIISLLIVFGWTIHAFLNGELHKQIVTRNMSPDGRHELFITKRFAIPVNELVDPSIVVWLFVQDTRTGRKIDREKRSLLEDSDLVTQPHVAWGDDSVVVTGLSRREEMQITLKWQN